MEQQTDLRPDGAVLTNARVNFGMNNWFVESKGFIFCRPGELPKH
jgi:hypothetical protein